MGRRQGEGLGLREGCGVHTWCLVRGLGLREGCGGQEWRGNLRQHEGACACVEGELGATACRSTANSVWVGALLRRVGALAERDGVEGISPSFPATTRTLPQLPLTSRNCPYPPPPTSTLPQPPLPACRCLWTVSQWHQAAPKAKGQQQQQQQL